MSLELTKGRAILPGYSDINIVDDLLTWLRTTPDAEVDLTRCSSAHMAVFQLLLIARPRLVTTATLEFERSDWRHLLARAGLPIALEERT